MSEQTSISLEEFAVPSPRRGAKAAMWRPPQPKDFAYGEVLAFDQTLSHTGWVALAHDDDDGLRLWATGMIEPCTDLTSHEGTYAKAEALERGIQEVVDYYSFFRGLRIVYERPAMVGKRIESALMAGREVHRASEGYAIAVANQHAKKVIVGRAGSRFDPVTKAHVKEAVERIVTPPSIRRLHPWNEHTRDAVMLALTFLYDLKQKERAA